MKDLIFNLIERFKLFDYMSYVFSLMNKEVG